MNARGYRRAVERQRRRDARSSRRNNTRENIGRGVRTFALVAGAGATVYGGRRLIQSGALNDVFTSRTLKNLVDDGRAIAEFAEGYGKAVSATLRSKGLGALTQDTSESLGKNLTKYLGNYAKRTGDIGQESIKGIRYLAELNKQRGIFRDREISKIQQRITKEIVESAAKISGTQNSTAAVNFINEVIDSNWQDIYLGSNSRKGKAGHNFIYDKVLKNAEKMAEKTDVSGFQDEIADILNAIKKDARLQVDDNKTAQQSFFDKVISTNGALRNELEEKSARFYRNSVRDIKTSLDVDNTRTGKLFGDAGLDQLTFKDILENPDILADQNIKKMGADFDPIKELREMENVLSKQEYDDFLNTAVDSAILKRENGSFTDLRHIGTTRNKMLNWLGENIEIPFIGIKPFKYVSMLDPSANRGGPMGYVFSRGTIMDTLTGNAGRLTDDLYMMGTVV